MVILIIFLCKRSGAECLGLDNDGNWSQNSWIAWWWWVCQSDWCHSKHLGQFVICDCCFISWLLVKVLGLKTKLKTVCNGYYYYFFWPISTKPQAWILRKSNNGCYGCSFGRHGVLKRDRIALLKSYYYYLCLFRTHVCMHSSHYYTLIRSVMASFVMRADRFAGLNLDYVIICRVACVHCIYQTRIKSSALPVNILSQSAQRRVTG